MQSALSLPEGPSGVCSRSGREEWWSGWSLQWQGRVIEAVPLSCSVLAGGFVRALCCAVLPSSSTELQCAAAGLTARELSLPRRLC